MEIKNKYVLEHKLGNGKFGTVFLGYYKKTNEKVAIKMEDNDSPIPLLKHETTILKYLYDHGSRNTPIVYWFGVHLSSKCLVMTYYDISLYNFALQRDLSQEQIDRIFLQSMIILENIHSHFILHRDIKPQNFMIKNGELFLIDFGFATFFVNEHGEHIEESQYENIVGTPKYISINIHNGISPSRRDDLISIGYIYIFLFGRELPWESIPNQQYDLKEYNEMSIHHYKNKIRYTLKMMANLEPICIKINDKLKNYFSYCYNLKHNEAPNYEAIKETFGYNIYKETI